MMDRAWRAVGHNDWRSVQPRPVGTDTSAPVFVSVIVPAHNDQAALDLCLAGLAAQQYPEDLFEVLVADDRSDPPLDLPQMRPRHTTIVPVQGIGYASGMARDVAARKATGDVLLFLDADVVPDVHHIDAHARWHEHLAYAVVLGVRQFIDAGGFTQADVAAAAAQGSIRALTEGRRVENHDWIDRVLAQTDDLTEDRDDLWRAVVGASVSTRRDHYERVGGFAHYPIRGIVDTEFGYRCFTGGGLIIPEREAYSLHLGTRTMATNREAIMRRRDALVTNLVPDKRYRRHRRGRAWSVPMVSVFVTSSVGATFEVARETVDDILGSAFDDIAVTIDPVILGADADLAIDYWRSDHRVRLVSEPLQSGFPSPFTAVVPIGARLEPRSVGDVLTEFQATEHGLMTLYADGLEGPIEIWRTRALERSILVANGGRPRREVVRDLFGEAALSAVEFGVAAPPEQVSE